MLGGESESTAMRLESSRNALALKSKLRISDGRPDFIDSVRVSLIPRALQPTSLKRSPATPLTRADVPSAIDPQSTLGTPALRRTASCLQKSSACLISPRIKYQLSKTVPRNAQ